MPVFVSRSGTGRVLKPPGETRPSSFFRVRALKESCDYSPQILWCSFVSGCF